jgi:hypothetical protein
MQRAREASTGASHRACEGKYAMIESNIPRRGMVAGVAVGVDFATAP